MLNNHECRNKSFPAKYATLERAAEDYMKGSRKRNY